MAEGRRDSQQTWSYYDVMVIGKTGVGKSTAANKLLGVEDDRSINYYTREPRRRSSAIKQWGSHYAQKTAKSPCDRLYFLTGDGATDSVTKHCQLLSNEGTKFRILDVPGFADSETTKEVGVMKGNLQVFRWIVRTQQEHSLSFRRVLYFLPIRGCLERADGILQEEITVMYRYFGHAIFDIMIIVATNHKRKQHHGFTDEDHADTRRTFQRALQLAIRGNHIPPCPPIVYIPLDEVDVAGKIIAAPVHGDSLLDTSKLEQNDQLFMYSIMAQEFKANSGTQFQFQDICTKCAVQIHFEQSEIGDRPVKVVTEKGESIAYNKSCCHPLFIPKYSKLQKFAGGCAHVATAGIPYVIARVRGKKSWPGFTNSDEICPICGHGPGSDGCSKMDTYVEMKTDDGKVRHVRVDHSKYMEKLALHLEEI